MILKRRLGLAVAAATAAVAILVAGCGSPDAGAPPPEAAPAGGFAGVPSGATGKAPGTTPVRALTGQEIAARSVAAYTGIETVRMDIRMNMALEIAGGRQPMEMTVAADGTGAIRTASSEMTLALNMDMEMPGLGKQGATSEMYIAGGWLYQKTAVPGMAARWTKMKLSDQMWAQQNQLAQQTEMLKTAVSVANLGIETVNGIDCYVLQIEPDMASLAGWAMSQIPGQTDAAIGDSADLGKMFKSLSVKQWVSRKDYLPVKADMTLVIDVPADSSAADGDAPEKVSMSISAAMNYYGYNQPVSIELPPEAAGAEDISPAT